MVPQEPLLCRQLFYFTAIAIVLRLQCVTYHSFSSLPCYPHAPWLIKLLLRAVSILIIFFISIVLISRALLTGTADWGHCLFLWGSSSIDIGERQHLLGSPMTLLRLDGVTAMGHDRHHTRGLGWLLKAPPLCHQGDASPHYG